LHLLKTVNLPVAGREIDLANADPAIQRALAALGREVIVFEDGRRLVPSSAGGRLSLPSDRSFDRYEDALAHADQPTAKGTGIYVDRGYFDAHLRYRWASRRARCSSRAARGPSRSTRRGTRRRPASSLWASFTSSPAPTICCFCSASSFRSSV